MKRILLEIYRSYLRVPWNVILQLKRYFVTTSFRVNDLQEARVRCNVISNEEEDISET